MIKPASLSDRQLVHTATRSLLLILALAIIATGLYLANNHPTRILGTTSSPP